MMTNYVTYIVLGAKNIAVSKEINNLHHKEDN